MSGQPFNLDQTMAAALMPECPCCHGPAAPGEVQVDGQVLVRPCEACSKGIVEFFMALVNEQTPIMGPEGNSGEQPRE